MNIAIIGGGAAGMMAAWSAKTHNPNADVTILERNTTLGHKVMISGGGRCNVTTGQTDRALILDCYPRGARFLASSLNAFPPEAVMDFFQSRGVPLKTEKDLRVFPKSDQGKDIMAVFEKEFNRLGVKVRLKSTVESIRKNKDFEIKLKDGETLHFDVVILTTGGQAYRHTGSQGDGYTFAESLGHSITTLAPSLNAFIVQEDWPHELAGVSLKVKLSTKTDQAHTHSGPILFTHKGITGPAVFALSAKIAHAHYDIQNPLKIVVDFLPDHSQESWISEMQLRAAAHPKMALVNLISQGSILSLNAALLKNIGENPQNPAQNLNEKAWTKLAETFKHTPIHAVGRAAGDEFVTAGGVSLKEVDPKTLQSKICPGLYFAGEILDIDGFTGGFNLQAAWCTGYASGKNLQL